MATDFKRTLIQAYPRVTDKETTDNVYWKALEVPVTKKEYGAISHIEFSPTEPYNYAVTNSTRVQIYSSQTNKIVRTLNRFRDTTRCGSFRNDGQLIVAGTDDSYIKLFEATNGTLLRVFRGHQGPVYVTKFLNDGIKLMSASNDRTVRIWDIPTEKSLHTFREHKDYIRCGVCSKTSNDIILTGSYDRTIRLFDTRMKESVMTVDHGHPVESLIMFPHGSIFISAGGNVIKVWDTLAGGRLLATLANHHKTVTSLGFCSNYMRFTSASLDKHVKIYDVSSYQLVHTLDYPGSILSHAVSPDDSLVVVGMADGLLSLQKRKKEENAAPVKKRAKSFRYALAGKTHIPLKDDLIVEHKHKEMQAQYDKYLRQFKHARVLDVAFCRTTVARPEITVSIIQELMRRDRLRAALTARSNKFLIYVVKFIKRHIRTQSFTHVLTDVANLVIEMYWDEIGQGTELDNALKDLNVELKAELNYKKSLMQLMGAMDTLFASASGATVTTFPDTSSQPLLVPSESTLST